MSYLSLVLQCSNVKRTLKKTRAMRMVITVPEKSNVTCQMMSSDNGNDGCDVTVLRKLEGDVHHDG